MKRVSPSRAPGIPREYAPEINWVYVDERIRKAKVSPANEAAIREFVQLALADYWREKCLDEATATPAQVRDYADRLDRVVAMLEPKDQIEATILRAAISPFEFADRVAKIEAVIEVVRTLQTPTERGSGERLGPARQRRLAKRFLDTFAENKWPPQTSAGSLMAQLLLSLLKAVGEGRGTAQLLKEAQLET